MLTLLAFLLTLGVLITVHEYGHYLAARRCGVKVLQFSIGFGKPLWMRRFGRDRTEFIVAALPLGGYVRMLDEREAPVPEAELARAFNRQSVWRRIVIVSAGPLANLLLAIVLYWALFMSGVTGVKPLLGEVEEGSAAAHASMRPGTLITRVAGEPVTTWQDVRWQLLQQSLKTSRVEVETLSGEHEAHLHQLDLSALALGDPDGDVLTQLGLSMYRPPLPPVVGEVLPDGAAARDGLKAGDEILSVNGAPIAQWDELVGVVRQHPGRLLALEVRRGDAELTLTLRPDTVQEHGLPVGRIGAVHQVDRAALDPLLVEVRHPPLQAFGQALGKTWDTAWFSLKMLGNMLTGAVSWQGVSGPITIASYAGQSAQHGLEAFLTFLALVSISLGVLNLLPVPMLDGGHLMYYMVEILKGSPVSERTMAIGQKIGLLLLALLMAAALYNDINRLITG